ncbi:unnamed protein product [Moneuplotes crassus]|uniref:Uncharacterized protein n=1 Tax=Euplotes crassus TaxID=5936 RepID=A0AAD1XGW8_EUPCR|nr:unnamed protein product [Moneuplotes crassus]
MSKKSCLESNSGRLTKKFKSEVVKDESDFLFSMPTLESSKPRVVDANKFGSKCPLFVKTGLKITCGKKPRKMTV